MSEIGPEYLTRSARGTNIGPTPLRDIQPSKLQRSPSHESLSAHPLFTLNPSSSSMPSTSIGDSPSRPGSASKYLPYTPRQRLSTATATIGAAVQSPVSVQSQYQRGDATSKLQLQSLKAAAQDVGLDAGSLGWAMLEELVCGADHGPTWNEIWNAVTIGEAKLLLPIEHYRSNERISSDFMKDHIIFCNGSSRENAPFVTMSGLRGEINDNIVIKSTLSPLSKSFVALISPSTRSSTLSSLPPLPLSADSLDLYPKYDLPSYSDTLPLPPRASTVPKPPLPPRPGARPTSSQGTARLPNPFSSFFSKTPPSSSPALLPTPDPQPSEHPVNISAFTIVRHINRREVSKTITKVIKSHIREYLNNVPSWVIDRVYKFSVSLQPFPRSSRKVLDGDGNASPSTPTVTWYDSTPEELEQSLQSFYESLECDLEAELKHRPGHDKEQESETDVDNKEEKEVRKLMEMVEQVLCCLFYDKLYRPSSSDDASHDEALSSRIAALNILDLTLEHLGVELGSSAAEVDSAIAACGQTIQQLQAAYCPADKATILVAAHKVIVDGLSKLPPLQLKSETENTQRQSSSGTNIITDTDIAEHMVKSSQPANLPATASDIVSRVPIEPVVSPRTSTTEEYTADQTAIVENEMQSEKTLLVIPPPHTPTIVSGDVLLPLLIYSVVKANPPQLVSHLLFTQRYRNRAFGGEESYCLINLMAVVEFLENVDLEVLGLKDSEKTVLSIADLKPIPIVQTSLTTEKVTPIDITGGIRGRVEQQVDAIAGSANKVISGVMDSSFGVLRSLLPINTESSGEGGRESPWSSARPGFGLLRRETGFSIASLAASLPGRERSKPVHPQVDEGGQEMIESRPGSIKGVALNDPASMYGDSEESETLSESESAESEEPTQDAKSIRRLITGRRRSSLSGRERMSLTDRLASMSRLTRGSHSSSPSQSMTAADSLSRPPLPPRRVSTLSTEPLSSVERFESSRSPSPQPPIRLLIPPPNQRFLECSVDDIKMSEVRELLLDYRRLAEHIQAMGDFMA